MARSRAEDRPNADRIFCCANWAANFQQLLKAPSPKRLFSWFQDLSRIALTAFAFTEDMGQSPSGGRPFLDGRHEVSVRVSGLRDCERRTWSMVLRIERRWRWSMGVTFSSHLVGRVLNKLVSCQLVHPPVGVFPLLHQDARNVENAAGGPRAPPCRSQLGGVPLIRISSGGTALQTTRKSAFVIAGCVFSTAN